MTLATDPLPEDRCRSILLVEDDPAIRASLAWLLEDEGFEVRQAGDGAEALEELRTVDTSCLILLDLMLPGMNGYQFVRELQARESGPASPIVVITAFSDAAEEIAPVAVLRKPVELHQLLQVAKTYCTRLDA